VLTKDIVLKKIVDTGSKGITRSEIYKGKKSEKEVVENIVKTLIDEGYIIEKNRRLYSKEKISTGEEFVQLKDFLAFKKETSKELDDLRGLISQLKGEIDRAYDYINDVFIYMKGEREKTGSVDINTLKMIYDNLNAIHNFGDSVPIPIFKDEVKKKFNIKDEEIDKILLDLDTKEIIYLQTLDNPEDFNDSDRGIKFEGRTFYFITWMKREY